MSFDFPNAPTLNQIATAPNGSYRWDGTKWVTTGTGGFLALSGGTVTGAVTFGSTVTLAADPTTALQASTKQYADRVPPVIATIAALRTSTATTLASTQCMVHSYTGTTTKGGGRFVYVSTDTTTLDNGGTVIVDASGRRWYRETARDNALNVTWFGTVGDGVANDTAALQAALTVAVSPGLQWSHVYIPAGRYLCTAPLTATLPAGNSINITGDGQDITDVRWSTATGNGLVINYAVANWWDHPSAATIESLSLTTQTDTTGCALTINGNFLTGQVVAQTTVRDVTIKGVPRTTMWLNGIIFNAVAQTFIENIAINGIDGQSLFPPKGNGISYFGTAAGIATAQYIVGANLFFLDRGVQINTYIEGLLMFAVAVTACNWGVSCPGTLVSGGPVIQMVSMSECQMACYQMCLDLTCAEDCAIDGSLLFLLAAAPTNTFVVLLDTVLRCQITGSQMTGVNQTGQVGVGFQQNAAGLAFPQNVYPSIITGNIFNNLSIGVAIDAKTGGLYVGENVYGAVPVQVLNNSDTGGFWGEYITQDRLAGQALPLPSNTYTTVVAISLPAGDWSISGQAVFVGTNTTQVQGYAAGVSLNPVGIDLSTGVQVMSLQTFTVAQPQMASSFGPYRFYHNVRTSYYVAVTAAYTGGAINVYGAIHARRESIRANGA